MLTVVLLLLLPAVFSLSVFHLYQLPRDLRAPAVRVKPRNKPLATFCRRYGHVFRYHNGAQSYYGATGFRGSLQV